MHTRLGLVNGECEPVGCGPGPRAPFALDGAAVDGHRGGVPARGPGMRPTATRTLPEPAVGAHALTWKPEDVSAAIDEFPAQAADALAAIQFGLLTPLTVDVLKVAAAKDGRTVTALWVDQLERMDKLDAFAEAMRAQGAPLKSPVQDLPPEVADRIDPERLHAFTPSAMAFRCRIFKNGAFAGSGCLVGPSLALTAWHVVAVNPPGQVQDPAPEIKIRLSDGRFLDAAMPPRFASVCGDREFGVTRRSPTPTSRGATTSPCSGSSPRRRPTSATRACRPRRRPRSNGRPWSSSTTPTATTTGSAWVGRRRSATSRCGCATT